MIVAKQKPLQEIYEAIKDHNRVLVLGCNTCVAVCHAGGGKEAELLASLLRILAVQKGREDMEVTHAGIERQCEHHEDFEPLSGPIEWADAVVSTACGAGIQFVAERYPQKPVYPGVDTVFMGTTEEPGLWTERCQGCGQCILGRTGTICPVSRCAKRLLNGPCGGSSQGKCEINPELDCAWQLIVDRLKELGELESLEEVSPIKDWSTERAGGPRKVVKDRDPWQLEE
jgi:ferredoxin